MSVNGARKKYVATKATVSAWNSNTTRRRLPRNWLRKPLREVAARQPEVGEHDGVARRRRFGHAERPADLRRERDQDADDVPDRHADQDHGHVLPGPLPGVEQLQHVAAARADLLHVLEHARLVDADTQRKQREAHDAADDVGDAPVEVVADEGGDDRAEDARRRDDRGAVAARLLRHDLADQRDARAQLACQPDAGDEAQPRVGLDRLHPRVGDVGGRVHEDRPEQHAQAALAVAEHAPQQAAEQHAGHLHVEQALARVQQVVTLHAETPQARDADDAEEEQVVDVDEVAERRDHHRQGDHPLAVARGGRADGGS